MIKFNLDFQLSYNNLILSLTSNCITVMGNTDKKPGCEMAWQANSFWPKRVLGTCFEVSGKMEVFELPVFGVFLAGMALYNFYKCVPAVKLEIRLGPYGSLCKEDFYTNMIISLLSLCLICSLF
jgi:hypothetical protein